MKGNPTESYSAVQGVLSFDRYTTTFVVFSLVSSSIIGAMAFGPRGHGLVFKVDPNNIL